MPAPVNRLLDVIHRARAITDAVIVAYSCGKDSAALLDLCAEHFPRIEAYYCCVVPGMSFHETAIGRAEKRYGIKIHRLPHWQRGALLRQAVLRIPNPTTHAIPNLTIADIEAEARRRTGLSWIAQGHNRHDSLERCAMLSACNGIDPKSKRFFPLMWATSPFVFRYLRRRKIPLSGEYAVFKGSYDGSDLSAPALIKLRDHFPDDYRRVLEWFPLAGAEVYRYEQFGDKRPNIPAVTRERFRNGLVEIPKELQGVCSAEPDEVSPG